MSIQKSDPQISELIQKEEQRQREQLQMIPSENYASSAVLEPLASVLSNKYSEGYPKKRYYQGNQYIDEIELIAIERAKQLFKAEYVNIQPLSGSPANLAVYLALLEPGSKIMAMNLSSGGHLSHGSAVNFISKLYNFVFYDVDKKTEHLDYEQIKELALKEKPALIIAGASAYSQIIDFEKFKQIADEVDALFMADIAHIAGLVATQHHPSPVPFADVVTTTTHKTLRGPRGGLILAKQKYEKALKKSVFPGGVQAGPHNNVHAAKAVCFKEAMSPEFSEYSGQIIKNAKALANELKKFGWRIVSGDTQNHLILVDTLSNNISGKLAAEKLEQAGIICNYNMIPYDTQSPLDPSGIRLGTPALTSRKMKEREMIQVASFINNALKSTNETELNKIKNDVKHFASKYFVPGIDD